MVSVNCLVSIIVPIFNVEDYLPQCIDSLIAQSHSNIEIILIDDGSTDGCAGIVDRYAAQDRRIVAVHQPNGGISAARNTGLDVMRGDYVMFVDGDDYVEKDFCKEALETAIHHQVDIVSFGFNSFWGQGEKVSRKATREPRLLDRQEAIRELITRREVMYNYAWNKIYKNTLFDHVRFPAGRTFEDVAVMHQLFDASSTGIFVSNLVLYNYRRERPGNVMSSMRSATVIHDRLLDEMERLSFVQEHYPAFENKQLSSVVEVCFQGLTLLPSHHKDRKEIKSFLQENKNKCLRATCGIRKKRLLAYYYMPLLSYLATQYVKLRYYRDEI